MSPTTTTTRTYMIDNLLIHVQYRLSIHSTVESGERDLIAKPFLA